MSVFSWLNQLYGSVNRPVEAPSHRFEEPLLYKKGTVIESIRPGGKGVIKLQGVYWIARSSASSERTIPTNALVAIKARRGLTLIVEPLLDGSVRRSRSPISAPSLTTPFTRQTVGA
jgi:membrane protein implicated in regulation of membrane protease activity